MILLVADDAPAAVDTALPDATVDHVTSAAAAKEPSGRPDIVVVHAPSIPDAAGLVTWLRSDASWDPRVPLIVLSETPLPDDVPLRPYDAVIEPTDEPGLAAAIQTASAVSGYRSAVDELYERCLDRANDGAGPLDIDPAVMDARERADECLASLPDDPEILAALLADPSKRDHR